MKFEPFVWSRSASAPVALHPIRPLRPIRPISPIPLLILSFRPLPRIQFIRGAFLPTPAIVRSIPGCPKTGKLPNEPKPPSTHCQPNALPSNTIAPAIAAVSPTMSPKNEPKLLSPPAAERPRPCGQIRPNQTTFFAAPQSTDKGQRRSAGAKVTSGRFRLAHLLPRHFSCFRVLSNAPIRAATAAHQEGCGRLRKVKEHFHSGFKCVLVPPHIYPPHLLA